ncbi:adenylate and guanylate cyclase catalytic domain-containing protein [Mycobacterium triplex]|uniref:Adenylate and guanylate cyclase catalytic domain-containing protein n=1 Tax=Mycobacterium triplex TaxID=47839 RepID=A0A024K308_9MYCO|nr:adenylate and guanylate cyclase catalytic domain-containing protein [Mycobacterium triplex]
MATRRGVSSQPVKCRGIDDSASWRIGLGEPLVQPGADLVGGVGAAFALITHDQRTPGHDTGDAGQADPLPNAAHT